MIGRMTIKVDADGALDQEQLHALDDETLTLVRKVMNEFIARGVFEIVGLNQHGEPVYQHTSWREAFK